MVPALSGFLFVCFRFILIPISLCAWHVCAGDSRSQKRVLGPLELQLQVGCELSDVDAGSQTQPSTPLCARLLKCLQQHATDILTVAIPDEFCLLDKPFSLFCSKNL